MSSRPLNLAPARNWMFTWNNPHAPLIEDGLLPHPGYRDDPVSPVSSPLLEGTLPTGSPCSLGASVPSSPELSVPSTEPASSFCEEAALDDHEVVESPPSSGHCSADPRSSSLGDSGERAAPLAYPAERICDIVFERLSAVRHDFSCRPHAYVGDADLFHYELVSGRDHSASQHPTFYLPTLTVNYACSGRGPTARVVPWISYLRGRELSVLPLGSCSGCRTAYHYRLIEPVAIEGHIAKRRRLV